LNILFYFLARAADSYCCVQFRLLSISYLVI